MVRKGNLAVFESSNISKTEEDMPTKIGVCESSNISETGEDTPTKIGVHLCDINPYMHEFFETIPTN